MGYGGPAPFAFARPSPQPRHLHRRAGLVDEDQPFRSEPCLAFEPEPAPREHVRALLLRCMAGLFLCVSPRLAKKCQTVDGQLRNRAGRFVVVQALGACLIEPVHPVAQALAVHAANRRRIPTVHAIINRRNRQKAAHLIGICRFARQGPRLDRVIVRSQRDLRRHQILHLKPAFYESHHCAVGNP